MCSQFPRVRELVRIYPHFLLIHLKIGFYKKTKTKNLAPPNVRFLICSLPTNFVLPNSFSGIIKELTLIKFLNDNCAQTITDVRSWCVSSRDNVKVFDNAPVL